MFSWFICDSVADSLIILCRCWSSFAITYSNPQFPDTPANLLNPLHTLHPGLTLTLFTSIDMGNVSASIMMTLIIAGWTHHWSPYLAPLKGWHWVPWLAINRSLPRASHCRPLLLMSNDYWRLLAIAEHERWLAASPQANMNWQWNRPFPTGPHLQMVDRNLLVNRLSMPVLPL